VYVLFRGSMSWMVVGEKRGKCVDGPGP
jgi:hypothetical protein